jgi:hypothetical protein
LTTKTIKAHNNLRNATKPEFQSTITNGQVWMGFENGDASRVAVSDVLAALKECAPAAFEDALKAHLPTTTPAPTPVDMTIREGDMVECLKDGIDLQVGKHYGPVARDFEGLYIKDDRNDTRHIDAVPGRYRKVTTPAANDNAIREGDMVECLRGGTDLVVGKVYGPVYKFGSGLAVRDDGGDPRLISYRFRKVTTPAETVTEDPIKVGDMVECFSKGGSNRSDLTIGRTYKVLAVGTHTLRINDDDNINWSHRRDWFRKALAAPVAPVETIKVGDTVEIVARNGHYFKVGELVTVQKVGTAQPRRADWILKGVIDFDPKPGTQYVDYADFKSVDMTIRKGDTVECVINSATARHGGDYTAQLTVGKRYIARSAGYSIRVIGDDGIEVGGDAERFRKATPLSVRPNPTPAPKPVPAPVAAAAAPEPTDPAFKVGDTVEWTGSNGVYWNHGEQLKVVRAEKGRVWVKHRNGETQGWPTGAGENLRKVAADTIKAGDTVECIDNAAGYQGKLTIGRQYTVSEVRGVYVVLKADNGQDLTAWAKRFRKVAPKPAVATPVNDNEVRVGDTIECIKPCTGNLITVGKRYTVLKVTSGGYTIVNDTGRECLHGKWWFKKVQPEAVTEVRVGDTVEALETCYGNCITKGEYYTVSEIDFELGMKMFRINDDRQRSRRVLASRFKKVTSAAPRPFKAGDKAKVIGRTSYGHGHPVGEVVTVNRVHDAEHIECVADRGGLFQTVHPRDLVLLPPAPFVLADWKAETLTGYSTVAYTLASIAPERLDDGQEIGRVIAMAASRAGLTKLAVAPSKGEKRASPGVEWVRAYDDFWLRREIRKALAA